MHTKISFLNDGDSLAHISLRVQVTLHSRVHLFALQQSQMVYQPHSLSIKQKTHLIQQTGQRLANESAIQLNHLSHFSFSFTALHCHSPLLQ